MNRQLGQFNDNVNAFQTWLQRMHTYRASQPQNKPGKKGKASCHTADARVGVKNDTPRTEGAMTITAARRPLSAFE